MVQDYLMIKSGLQINRLTIKKMVCMILMFELSLSYKKCGGENSAKTFEIAIYVHKMWFANDKH